jgi:sulfite reductase (NADPH) hemoprotein beta-component
MAEAIERDLAARPAVAARAPSLRIKISGCPNGCGQHYVAGIGLQGSVRKLAGRAVPQYFVYLGGAFGQEDASFGRLAAKLPARRVPEGIARLTGLYERERGPDETPEHFFAALDPKRAEALLADLETLTVEEARPEDFVDLGEEQAFNVQIGVGECAA